jgi:HSP20 family protein
MSKINITKVPTVEDQKLPVFAEFEKLMDHIRDRAYKLFESRGFEDGFQLDDWLRAEHEFCWPAAELDETDDEYMLKIALAGFEPKDITVTANPRELIVRAQHEAKHVTKKPSIAHWSDFQSNDVYRRVEFPGEVDVAKISAEFKHGMLTIEAPKAMIKQEPSRNIEITEAA